MKAQLVPCHVAIIMDGNGRWAKHRLLPRSMGHRAGLERMIPLVEHAFSQGVEFVTLYALSTENLSRPKDEVEGLFNLMREYFSTNLQRLQSAGIKLKVIGDRTLLPSDIVELIEKGEEGTSGGKKGVLTLAIAYGGRQEIAAAAALAAKEGEVSPETLSRHLQTADLPDPDLIIRTGKEQRISNFLLWQSAYAELYFSGKMFPDFSPKEFDKALKDYAGRDRRYGRVTKDGE